VKPHAHTKSHMCLHYLLAKVAPTIWRRVLLPLRRTHYKSLSLKDVQCKSNFQSHRIESSHHCTVVSCGLNPSRGGIFHLGLCLLNYLCNSRKDREEERREELFDESHRVRVLPKFILSLGFLALTEYCTDWQIDPTGRGKIQRRHCSPFIFI